MHKSRVDSIETDLNYAIYPFTVSIIIIILLSLDILFASKDAESAKYMLSALVQSEAAIIAIFITLSLVAVQMTASSYSERVIEVFKDDLYLKILIAIYMISMIYGLCTLKLITADNVLTIESDISRSFIVGVVAFLVLILYLNHILNLLDPHRIIDILSQKMINNPTQTIANFESENDFLQPIMDILIGSLKKYDDEILRYGLETIFKNIDLLSRDFNWDHQQGENFIIIINKNIALIGNLAISRKDGYAAIEIMNTNSKIGLSLMRLNVDASVAVRSFRELGIRGIENGLREVASEAVNSLGIFGT
jgi:hypothetical protein